MKKQGKKIALMVVFAMVLSLFAPAAQAEAAVKKFTYAEQETGDPVTVIIMEPGEVVDLKFMGVSGWRNYTRKWVSSNSKCAKVDQNGKITALKKGTAKIELLVGDGSVYDSEEVVVYVSNKKQELTIGDGKQTKLEDTLPVTLGDKVQLTANGLLDNFAGRYRLEWSSLDTSVATVDANGKITLKAPGWVGITLNATKVSTGETFFAYAQLWVSAPTPTPSISPTPTPTPRPTPTTGPEPGAVVDVQGTMWTVTEEFDKELVENHYVSLGYYAAHVAPVSQFVTADGGYGVAYHGGTNVTILLYDTDLKLNKKVVLEREEGSLGAVTCDEDGYFYAAYGIGNTTEDVSKEAMRFVKYSATGEKLKSVSYTGDETGWGGMLNSSAGDGSGTKIPFDAANCSMAVADGMLVCTYGRGMYNGHQSSNSLYVKVDTMEKIPNSPVYTSHSFDQQVVVAKNGDFLFVDHGDAFGRAFALSKLSKNASTVSNKLESFHFREGTYFGYNETFAQLGGLAELPNSYVLVAASERTLSYDLVPVDSEYCGYSEPRDLFIQYIKKDFTEYSGKDCYVVEGETRTAVGTRPTDALTELWLPDGVEDYGVLWLTNYTGDEMVYNPKVVTTESGEVIILWSKVLFETGELVDTYYLVLDEEGAILQRPVSIGQIPLSTDEPVVYLDGSIYWSITEGKTLTSYRFVISPDITERLKDDITWQIFDADYYLQNYPYLKETVGTDKLDLYLHWINVGISQGQSASPLLVPYEYLALNKDVAEKLGYDLEAAVKHFLEYGMKAGLQGSVSEGVTVEPFETMITVAPEGTKQYLTPDGRQITMKFENGRMVQQKFLGEDGQVKENFYYNYYNDAEDTSCLVRSLDNYPVAWQTEHPNGKLKSQSEECTVNGFEYMRVVSENADGTITLQYENVAGGKKKNSVYAESGELSTATVYTYNGAEQWSQRELYEYAYENSILKGWTVRTYDVNGNLLKSIDYAADGNRVVVEELPELTEKTIVPNGKYNFRVGEDTVVTLVFGEDGRMTEQKYCDNDGRIKETYRYHYYNDPEDTYCLIRNADNHPVYWHTEHPNGSVKGTSEDDSKGGFQYVEILSENTDGTITVQYKKVKAGYGEKVQYDEWGYVIG